MILPLYGPSVRPVGPCPVISKMCSIPGTGPSTYWLWPFKNYKTFCPYLVGSYERVSEEVAKYIKSGFTNFILDIPAEERDVMSAGIVFAQAAKKAA